VGVPTVQRKLCDAARARTVEVLRERDRIARELTLAFDVAVVDVGCDPVEDLDPTNGVGVADARRVPLIAGALQSLGTRHALVVHGEPGMDEISPLGPTQVIEIRDGSSREWTI